MGDATTIDTVTSGTHQGERPATIYRGGARWWWAVFAGALASLPLGWLLSYGAALMALLGLFFFALFGLVIGAVVFRVGQSARPIHPRHIKIGTALVTIVCWGLSMAKEVHDFPQDKARFALKQASPLPDGVTAEAFKRDVIQFVQDQLETGYGGTGFVGYARWVMGSSRMEYPVETMVEPIVLSGVQHRGWWALRVILSVVLLAAAIHAQVASLSSPAVAPVTANDRSSAHDREVS